MTLIFTDIDGVLNTHIAHPNGYNGTTWECVRRFNRILAETDAKIVVSSAWRYLVLNGHLTLVGLENLLLTHGVDCRKRVVGVTGVDTATEHDDRTGKPTRFLDDERGAQIAWYMRTVWHRTRYVVIDDGGTRPDGTWTSMGIIEAGHPFVPVDGTVGLTDADADRAIAILNQVSTDITRGVMIDG